jgi:hypothetical protein
VTVALFGYESRGWDIPWADVLQVKPTWLGMQVDYRQRGTHYELVLRSLGLWGRFEVACQQHGFEFVDPA